MKQAGARVIMGALCILADPIAARAQVSAPPSEDRAAPPDESEQLLVTVTINGAPRDGNYLVARRGETFLLQITDLARWRIRVPTGGSIVIDGDAYVALSALPGASATFDEPGQRLQLAIPAELFEARSVSASTPYAQPTEGAFAAFLNYDLSAEYRDGLRGNAFLEAGVSDDWGLVANTVAIGQGTGGEGITRLDSYYLRDDPRGLTRLVIGDTVTDVGDWSRQVRFGGVRWGTEFSLQPGLVTFPTPAFAGRAAIPSNVELLVNDALRFQTEVDQGPFSINQVPLVTGSGDVTLVVRDALGVERRVTSSYYVSSRLLSEGLSAWSLEAGFERRNYGIRSFDYRNPFAAGSVRHGVTPWLTLEMRAEASGDVRMAGAGADVIWTPLGEFGLAGAASQGEDGSGFLYRVQFSRVTPNWNVAISYQQATRNFDQLGIDDDRERITDQFQASAGLSLRRWGNIGIAYTDLRYADGNRAQLASANYSVGIGQRGYANLFAIRSDVEGAGAETTFGVGFTIPFGPRSSAYAQADSRNILAEVRATPPTEGGWGYRIAASSGETDRQQAEVEWRGDVGEISMEAARFGTDSGVRLLASGGLLLAGGGLHTTRRVEDAVGVVEVPDLPNVRIYQENRLLTRTGRNGRAIIPDLRAYEQNRVAIAPADLPLDTRMPRDTLFVVPRYRGAAIARFPVEKDRPATILLQRPDGKAVDAGTSVRTDSGERLFVGYGGEVFVPDMRPGMSLIIDLPEGSCRTTIHQPTTTEILPRVGPLRCQEQGERQ